MKKVRVFFASSEELRPERNEFSDLVLQLNDILEHRGIQIQLVRWEHLDQSMGELHKQEEYNREIRQCEMCLVLYWTKVGEFTNIELDTAFDNLKSGANPKKLYVFFKEVDSVPYTPELLEFKESFVTKYGHFYCRFENVDTMRLNFVMQFEACQSNVIENDIFKIEDETVMIDGCKIADMNNIPFASMNKEFIRLKEEVSRLQRELSELRVRFASSPDDTVLFNAMFGKSSDLNKVKDEFKQYQGFLLNSALRFSRLSYDRYSERIAQARRYFEEGNASEADKILDEDEMKREAEAELAQYEQNLMNLEIKIEEFLLKSETSMANGEIPIAARFAQACSAFDEALHIAQAIGYEKEKYASILFKYAYLCQAFNKFSKAEDLYSKSIDIYRSLAECNPDAYQNDVAMTLNNLGNLHYDLNRYLEAEDEYLEALKLYRSLAASNPDAYQSDVAMTLNNLGNLHYKLNRYLEADKVIHNRHHGIICMVKTVIRKLRRSILRF